MEYHVTYMTPHECSIDRIAEVKLSAGQSVAKVKDMANMIQ